MRRTVRIEPLNCTASPRPSMSRWARYYERYADHAVAVARRIIYIITGQMPGPLA